MLHKIDLNSLNKNLEAIEKVMETFKTIEHLEQTLYDKVKLAKDKLRSLTPNRARRGLINALGTAIKYISGNPDNDDLEIIHQNLGILKTQENKLARNQMKQIQINELFANKLNNITESIRKISSIISREYNTAIGMRADLEFVNLIWNVDKIIHILEDIEEQVEFSRVGLINKNIFTLEEKELISNRLREQNLKINYLDEIFQYAIASVAISRNHAVLLVKTPILDQRTFDLLELHNLRINDTRINTYVNLVAKHGNSIYYQSTECDICDNNHLLEDTCIYNILTHQTPTCPLIRTKQATVIKEIKKGIILLDTVENIKVEDSCGNSRMVREATIIESGNCTIKIRNLTFYGQPEVIHQEEYLIPIYSKPLQKGNLSIPHDEDTMLQFQNLEEISEVQLSLNHLQRQITIGGTTLLALTLVCFFILYFYKKAKAAGTNETIGCSPKLFAAKKAQDNVSSNTVPTNENEPGRRDQGFIPTKRIELPTLQPRTLES